MANHKSAAKKARMSVRRSAINSRTMGGVRTVEKMLLKAIAGKKTEDAAKALVTYMSKMGKAAQKGRIHFSTASRKIGRLSRAVAGMSAK